MVYNVPKHNHYIWTEFICNLSLYILTWVLNGILADDHNNAKAFIKEASGKKLFIKNQ